MSDHRLLVVVAMFILTVATATSSSSHIVQAKSWVVPYVTTLRTTDDRDAMERIVARVGGIDLTVYESGPGDIQVGYPVVSRDGTQLAFAKIEDDGARLRYAIYAIGIDRKGLRPIVELTAPTMAPRGVLGGPLLAWSHDNRTLAVFGVPFSYPSAADASTSSRHTLATVDVATGILTPLIRLHSGTRGELVRDVAITTQAWSPDNRSLVYMNADGHAIILDTRTGVQHDMGLGHAPTWSPIGDEIAVQLPRARGTERGKRTDGDYYIIPVSRPGERRLLLENPRPSSRSLWRPDYMTQGYYGPALWSPDGKYLAVRRANGDAWDTYLVEHRTKRVERLTEFFKGDSWGGKP